MPDDYGNMFTGRQIHCEGMLSQGDTSMQCVGGINELTGTMPMVTTSSTVIQDTMF